MKTLKLLVLSLAFIACEKEEIEKPIQLNEIKTKHLDKAAAQSVFMGEWFSSSEVTGTPTQIVIRYVDNNIYSFESYNGTTRTISDKVVTLNDSMAVGMNSLYNISLVKRGNYVEFDGRVPFGVQTYFVTQTYRR